MCYQTTLFFVFCGVFFAYVIRKGSDVPRLSSVIDNRQLFCG